MKILILGHNGMLGNAAFKYFNKNHEIVTIEQRWDSDDFKISVQEADVEFVINCIGAISQKKFGDDYFELINVKLPEFLETIDKKIIHPSTDCVFSGNIKPPQMYCKDDERDAYDVYGKSKAKIDKMIVDDFKNTKIIRTSIIGHEMQGHVSLLDWFLGTDENVELNGYCNYYWNGITTLQWCKVAEEIMRDWDFVPIITQVGTEVMVKSNLLRLMGKIYGKSNKINDFEMRVTLNKALISDYPIQSTEKQLIELKKFYKK